MEETHPPAARSSLVKPLLAVLVLAAGVVAVWYFFLRAVEPVTQPTQAEPRDAPTPDPRLAYQTPFLNTRPDVKYVGDAACTACHRQISDSYHHHPMGRSAAVGAEVTLSPTEAGKPNTFRLDPYLLEVLTDGGKVRHRISADTPAGKLVHDMPVDVVIGSGTRGKSYLTVEHGSVWQSPVSWFTDDAKWNISPGFVLGTGGRRAIVADCLFCHVNHTDPVRSSTNLYKQAVVGPASIGCERCHGPGELHARKQADTPTGGASDDTIVNPKRLTGELQMDICRQCHLQGEQRIARRGREFSEFRPGMPLDLFMSVFVRRPDLADTSRSVGQFEQMERSTCFTKAGGAMTCTTCHDPHATPDPTNKAAFYNGKCNTCHASRGCTEQQPARQAKNDSCIACHMPRKDSTSIAHAAVTDHTISRRANQPPPRPAGSPAGNLPIVPYRKPHPHVPADEFDRDYGIALTKQMAKLPPNAADKAAAGQEAMTKLRLATTRFPADGTAWLHLAISASTFRQSAVMLDAVRKASELQPDSETILSTRFGAEMVQQEYGAALQLTDKLIALNPAAVEYRQMRATVFIVGREWAKAEEASRDAIAVNALSAEAHMLRAMALRGLNRHDESHKEKEIAFALETDPGVRKQFETWLQPGR